MGFIRDFFYKKIDTSKQTLEIENVRKGGVFHIRNYGYSMEEIDVSVTRVNMYSQGNYCWYELEGKGSNGQLVYVEIDKDGELIINATIKTDLKLKELGITKSELKEMDDEEEGEIKYEGRIYEYEDSGDATYYPECDEESGEPFYYFDFFDEESDTGINVCVWNAGGTDVSVYQSLRADQIEVYSIKSADQEG